MIRFMDTHALLAWLNPKDSAHAQVKEYMTGYEGRLVTTEWVLMEVADALARSGTRHLVIEFLNTVRADANYDIVAYEEQVYRDGYSLFASRHDKDWSLTDCISFAVMKHRNLSEALTADHHFTQAGFIAVFLNG